MTRIHQQQSRWQGSGWNRFGARRLQVVRPAIAALAALALAPWAMSQATSSLNGSVTDPSGAAVAGAKITLTNTATESQRTTESSAAGLYQFLDVLPGDYKLDATASGFAHFSASKVTLLVKLPSTLDIHFQLADPGTADCRPQRSSTAEPAARRGIFGDPDRSNHRHSQRRCEWLAK
jgi:hypothetical protein